MTGLVVYQACSIRLTKNRAMEAPRMKPATTSEQWLRYSDTRLSPVRNAAHSVPKHSTGFARRLLFVLIVLVMYIWNTRSHAHAHIYHGSFLLLSKCKQLEEIMFSYVAANFKNVFPEEVAQRSISAFQSRSCRGISFLNCKLGLLQYHGFSYSSTTACRK